MQPGPIELLNGIKMIIMTALLPEVQTETARAQVMYTTVLLDHLIARWDLEGPLLLEERAELRALLTRALGVLRDRRALEVDLRAALAVPDSVPVSPGALQQETDRMRRLVPVLSDALGEYGDAEGHRELAAALHAYIRNQHRRDVQLVQVGALAW
jgi:hypothetical protein